MGVALDQLAINFPDYIRLYLDVYILRLIYKTPQITSGIPIMGPKADICLWAQACWALCLAQASITSRAGVNLTRIRCPCQGGNVIQ